MGVGIQVETLNAWYGKTQALYDIGITVAANHATALDRSLGLRQVDVYPLPEPHARDDPRGASDGNRPHRRD